MLSYSLASNPPSSWKCRNLSTKNLQPGHKSKATRAATIIFRQEKKSIEFGRHLWMKVSHHSPLQKKKFDLELPKQRCPISRQPASDTSGPQFHPNGNGTSSRGPTQPTVPQAAMESPQPRWRSMDRMTSFTLSKLSRIKAWTNTKTCWGNSLQFTPVFPNKTGGTTVSTIYTTQTIIF